MCFSFLPFIDLELFTVWGYGKDASMNILLPVSGTYISTFLSRSGFVSHRNSFFCMVWGRKKIAFLVDMHLIQQG